MSNRSRPKDADARAEAVAAYKAILRDVLDRRPSGTRQRLAQALGKARSFISQITSPAYSIAIPARHLAPIFEICHFSGAEREGFLEAYRAAHPRSTIAPEPRARLRPLHLLVPDLGSDAANQELDRLIHDHVTGLAKAWAAASRRNPSQRSPS
jgi:hypothetical protein